MYYLLAIISKSIIKTYIKILYILLGVPIIGVFLISTIRFFSWNTLTAFTPGTTSCEINKGIIYILEPNLKDKIEQNIENNGLYKKIAFIASILNLIISLIVYILFDFSNNQFQFIQEHYDLTFYDIYLGVDGISIYFILLTTIIMPIALISN
jgi:hypothetical protein